MAFPHEHILIRFNGHFGAPATAVDRWSAGVRFGLPTSAPAYDPTKLQTFVNACLAAGKTFHTASGVLAGTNCYIDHVTGAQVGVLGKYVPAGQLTVVSPIETQAGTGSATQPYNVAGVISLRTGNPRGRASNGRIYWPYLAAAVDATTGRVTSANVGLRVTAAKAFLDALNTAASSYSTGMRVIVASNVGGGLIATVTKIRADGRLDSIERRENDLPVTYSEASLA